MPARKLRWRKDGLRDLTVEQAVYQYLLDHVSSIGPNGFVVCKIGLRSWEGFLASIEIRRKGKYRWSEEDIQKMYQRMFPPLKEKIEKEI